MIKLKSIISELDIHGGHAGDAGDDLFYELIDDGNFGSKLFRKLLSPETIRQIDRGVLNDKKWPPELKTNIKKMAVWSDGNIYLLMDKQDATTKRYYLVDISKPNPVAGFVGIMDTYITRDSAITKFLELPAEEVHWSYVRERGAGYGAKLYDAVLSVVGCLLSDETLYKGSYAMWTHHMQKSSAFFGALISPKSLYRDDSSPILIPIDTTTIDPKKLKKIANTKIQKFVSINDSVPISKTIRRFEYNMRGVDIESEFAIIFVDSKMNKLDRKYMDADMYPQLKGVKTFFEFVESADDMNSFLDMVIDNLPASYSGQNTKSSIEKLKILMCIFDDAVCLIKNAGSGLSVQLMD